MNKFVEKFDRLLLLTLKHGVNNKLEISTTVRRGLKGTPNHPCRIVPSKTSDHGMLNGELSHQRSFGIKLYFQGMFSVNSQHFEIFGILNTYGKNTRFKSTKKEKSVITTLNKM